MSTLLKNGRVLIGKEFLPGGCVLVDEDGSIAYAGTETGLGVKPDRVIDLKGQYLAPGLIDIHVHGGFGVRFVMDASLEADLEKYRGWVVQNGVTGFLTSVMAPSHPELLDLLRLLKRVPGREGNGAELLGVHLEGPYINPNKAGAIDPACLRRPDVKAGRELLAVGGALIRQITMAPELPGAMELAALFTEAGVTVALGHSTADYETACAAYEGPFSHTTHTYNAQSGLAHRAPGVVGALLQGDRATGELIADLFHVHPGAIRVLLRCLGPDRIALITDAMEAAGLSDGRYFLSGRERIVENGRSVLADGTIAGSTATLDQCVRNMVETVGVPLAEALWMASAVPARVIGENSRCGTIEAGKTANLIVLDADLNVQKTFVRGRLVFER